MTKLYFGKLLMNPPYSTRGRSLHCNIIKAVKHTAKRMVVIIPSKEGDIPLSEFDSTVNNRNLKIYSINVDEPLLLEKWTKLSQTEYFVNVPPHSFLMKKFFETGEYRSLKKGFENYITFSFNNEQDLNLFKSRLYEKEWFKVEGFNAPNYEDILKDINYVKVYNKPIVNSFPYEKEKELTNFEGTRTRERYLTDYKTAKHLDVKEKRENGAFYTPPHIALKMAKMTEWQPGETVFDPAVGSGNLLAAMMDTYPDLKEENLFGIDIDRAAIIDCYSLFPKGNFQIGNCLTDPITNIEYWNILERWKTDVNTKMKLYRAKPRPVYIEKEKIA